MSESEPGLSKETEEWIINQVDIRTRGWSDETWKILGITQDLIDLRNLRSSDQK